MSGSGTAPMQARTREFVVRQLANVILQHERMAFPGNAGDGYRAYFLGIYSQCIAAVQTGRFIPLNVERVGAQKAAPEEVERLAAEAVHPAPGGDPASVESPEPAAATAATADLTPRAQVAPGSGKPGAPPADQADANEPEYMALMLMAQIVRHEKRVFAGTLGDGFRGYMLGIYAQCLGTVKDAGGLGRSAA